MLWEDEIEPVEEAPELLHEGSESTFFWIERPWSCTSTLLVHVTAVQPTGGDVGVMVGVGVRVDVLVGDAVLVGVLVAVLVAGGVPVGVAVGASGAISR